MASAFDKKSFMCLPCYEKVPNTDQRLHCRCGGWRRISLSTFHRNNVFSSKWKWRTMEHDKNSKKVGDSGFETHTRSCLSTGCSGTAIIFCWRPWTIMLRSSRYLIWCRYTSMSGIYIYIKFSSASHTRHLVKSTFWATNLWGDVTYYMVTWRHVVLKSMLVRHEYQQYTMDCILASSCFCFSFLRVSFWYLVGWQW